MHLDASDADKLFTTFNGSGVHTGTPTDGSAVQVWDDEGDGIADVCMRYAATTGQSPVWRSVTPLMKLPCLDFDGSDDAFLAFTQTAGASKVMSSLITNAAFTLFMTFYAESITSVGEFQAGTCLVGDLDEYWGAFLRDDLGQRKVTCYNWDVNADGVIMNITENTSHLLMWRHEGGNLYGSLDGGAESSVASGNTGAVAGQFAMGKVSSAAYFNGRIGEFAIYNAALTGTPLSDAIAYFANKWLLGAGASVPVFQESYRRLRGK